MRCEPLEPRVMLAAVPPSNVEQFLLELINRARANPAAEAARFGIDLNEGLSPGTISPAPKQPLAMNPFLVDAARQHSQWMLDNDTFSHTGNGGSSPHQRMTAAGYQFDPPAGSGENIAWSGTTGPPPNQTTTTAELHEALFVDEDIVGRGHRLNILKPEFREVGNGVLSGQFNEFNAVMITEDFAFSDSDAFLTGVAFRDTMLDDDFYTVGEGLGDILITADDGFTEFTTMTWASGGYSLDLPAGTYTVTAEGPLGTVVHHDVVIGSLNVKRDFDFAEVSGDRIGVFRNGRFILDTNANHVFNPGTDANFIFGLPSDIPLIGDWQGDGDSEVGVFRNGRFILDINENRVYDHGVDANFIFGLSTDRPLVGDWDGDGDFEIGVFRNGRFILDINGNRMYDHGVDANFVFGLSTDIPLVGDWDGDGDFEIGVDRNGRFVLDLNGNRVFNPGVDANFIFGISGDIPVIGDWDGDGSSNVGIFRSGRFVLDNNNNRVFNPGTDDNFIFGTSGDRPLSIFV